MAVQGDAGRVKAHYGKLTTAQALHYADELGKLPALGRTADRFNWAERLTMLDGIICASRGRWRTFYISADQIHWGDMPFTRVQRIGMAVADWNDTMRTANEWSDRLVAAMSKPTRADRVAAVND